MTPKYNKSHIIPDNTNTKTNTTTSSSSIFRAPTQTYQTNPYIPMINVPTTARLPSPGEIVASVELLTAHVSELSRKIDRIESRVNDWVNLGLAERMTIAEHGIDALKTCHNDHDAKIARISQHYLSEKDGAELYERIQDLVDQNDDANKCLDRFSDILTIHTSKLRHVKHRSHNLAKKYAEIGILRRRVSKVEETNTEFAQCFETPTALRGILDSMDEQMHECDKAVMSVMRECIDNKYAYSNSHIEDLYRDQDMPSLEAIACDENGELCDGTDLNAYFSNYWDNTNTSDIQQTADNKEESDGIVNHIVINMDQEILKYGSMDDNNDGENDHDHDHDDDDFEKI